MAYCPDCISYNTECSVDPEDWGLDCDRFEPRYKVCEVCGETYDIDAGCINCACAAEAR